MTSHRVLWDYKINALSEPARSYVISLVSAAATPTGLTAAINTAIASLVGAAPATMDTLGEIAAILASDESAATALLASVATKTTPTAASAAAAALIATQHSADNATYGRGATLRQWQAKYASSPSTAKVYLIGDSTSDPGTAAVSIGTRLKTLHTARGAALDGIGAANITMVGNNGQTLLDYLAGNGTNNYAALLTAAPDLIVASYGLNDVRLGACSQATLVTRLTTLVTNIRRDLPGTDIVLRIPNPMLTTNTGGLHYVTESDGTTIASAATAQAYSTLIRDAYLSLTHTWNNVVIADVQAKVFGVQALPAHPLIGNQLHPTAVIGNIGSVPYGGGYVAIADYLATIFGFEPGPFPPTAASFMVRKKFTVVAGGVNYLDLGTFEGSVGFSGGGPEAAAQYPIATTDTLYVQGYPTALTISGVTARPFGGTNIRLSVVGDFTNYAGLIAVVGMNHPDRTTGDRQVVSVDLPSIAAGAIGTMTAAVVGARTGALHDATGIVCSAPAAFVTAGLVLLGVSPTANNVATMAILNPTGGAVDLAAANFAFWVIR
jgi:hypothetical protein